MLDFGHHGVDLTGLEGGGLRRRGAERRDLEAVAAPAVGARQFLGEPVGERTGGGDAHRAAFEIVLGPDRPVPGDHHHDGAGPVGQRRHREHRRALDLERDGGAAAEGEIDGVGGDGLHQPRIAAEIGDLEVDGVLSEDAGGEPDIGRQEGEVLRLGLADPHVDLRLCLRRHAAYGDDRGRPRRRAHEPRR